jgi:hypothetical protein
MQLYPQHLHNEVFEKIFYYLSNLLTLSTIQKQGIHYLFFFARLAEPQPGNQWSQLKNPGLLTDTPYLDLAIITAADDRFSVRRNVHRLDFEHVAAVRMKHLP